MNNDPKGIAEEQTCRYLQAVDRGLPRELIENLSEYVKDARPLEIYSSHVEVPLIYEILEKEGWRERVGKLVDHWVEVCLPLSEHSLMHAYSSDIGRSEYSTCSRSHQKGSQEKRTCVGARLLHVSTESS